MDIIIYTILLSRLYGDVIAKEAIIRLIDIVERHQNKIADRLFSFDLSRDGCNPVLLITYPDQVQTFNQPHLKTLSAFCKEHFQNIVSGIHILPFFLWSSDDGFSVMNYRKVDPSYGNWDDIEAIGTSFDLMIDSVLNHASAQGDWFQAFIQNEVPYNNYFVTIEGNPDLSKVVRPRTSPLLTTVQTRSGLKKVWTTFGSDQVDLDYKNPEVLLEMIDIILLYISHGARYLRLDAIAYLWKVIGTSCIHLPQTHTVVQLLRSILNDVAPDVKIITETNVPHHENISYFGNGTNEAHLVYNFALPPLVLHTLLTGDATALSEWAANLELPSRETTFFNFLASHDGIGLNPVRGILSAKEIDQLVKRILDHGGLISYKTMADGTQSPYEMNISYFDAVSNPNTNEPLSLKVDRFMAAYSIALSLKGIPGIYFHSIVGSRSWLAGPQKTGQNRSINRQKFDRDALSSALSNPDTLQAQVYRRFQRLLSQYRNAPAFHPYGNQKIIQAGKEIFCVLRSSCNGKDSILCLQNVTSACQSYQNILLQPYQTVWIDHPDPSILI